MEEHHHTEDRDRNIAEMEVREGEEEEVDTEMVVGLMTTREVMEANSPIATGVDLKVTATNLKEMATKEAHPKEMATKEALQRVMDIKYSGGRDRGKMATTMVGGETVEVSDCLVISVASCLGAMQEDDQITLSNGSSKSIDVRESGLQTFV